MNHNSSSLKEHPQHASKCNEVKKARLDLVILKYMARRLHFVLRQLDQASFTSKPLLYRLQERRGLTHRIAIYQYQELMLEQRFTFVGFIGKKQNELPLIVVDEIAHVDKLLIEELVGTLGILSYSSLELRNGDWCNLVVLSNPEAKEHITEIRTHGYAAYQLAHRYYEWIRLHNGIMTEGLDHNEMVLQKTKHYTFQATQQRPSIRERVYV